MPREAFLRREDRKQRLNRTIFGGLVPDYVFSRRKARAQIGGSDTSGGVLMASVNRGFDSDWLRQRFARLHGGTSPAALGKFIRAGRYCAAVPTSQQDGGDNENS